ncbi:NADH dehydrogenase ubiquinone 1 alpha subcomplex subunit 1 [Cinnamomum micranthum f. kanehirae]|uniref:NADH dehydrogenase [ubiquinone] 1 alpha subcomplex subunit 1 n=1 Tax=Cinnamomum micranthum f. kanehirae TaxID=337451 RepID=A0A443NKP0_9MAGN|nr:NADH dehydrogenase ubiquinone 1 alpha subcomplex subunit 1 [Cinnamomum micranthum f. kanehirae]
MVNNPSHPIYGAFLPLDSNNSHQKIKRPGLSSGGSFPASSIQVDQSSSEKWAPHVRNNSSSKRRKGDSSSSSSDWEFHRYFWRSCSEKMSLVWLEALLPLGIIGGMLCVMGNAQYYIHKAAHGRPKHVGNDVWDVAMERRDKKLMEKAAAGQD